MSWLSTGLQVAEVATNILSGLVGAADEPTTGQYTVGTIDWYYDAATSKVYAYNSGNSEAALTFARAEPNLGVAEVQPIPPKSHVDVATPMSDFAQGQVAAAPSVEALLEGPGSRVVTFTIGALALGVTTRIVTGVDVSVGRNQQTGRYDVSISTPAVPFSADVRASDYRGNSVSANGKIGGSASQDPQTLVIELPLGVDLSPIVSSLTASLTMPTAFYEQATAEQRKRAQAGLPAFLRQPTGVR